jgi:hypothetical protein
MKFLIKSVDIYGYCGRENHPSKSDEGLVVTAIKMEAFYFGEDGAEEPVIGNDGRLYVPALNVLRRAPDQDGWDGVQWVWTCVTEDGRVLDLMDHEIEPLKVAR